MKIKDVMSAGVVTIQQQESTKTAVEVMEQKGINHLVVNNEKQQMIGVISMKDIRLIENIGSENNSGDVDWEPFVIDDVEVSHLMSSPVITLHSEAPIKDAAEIMLAQEIHCFPVKQGEEVLGIITEKDLLAAIADERIGAE